MTNDTLTRPEPETTGDATQPEGTPWDGAHWVATLLEWDAIRSQLPDTPETYVASMAALQRAGQEPKADRVLGEAVRRFAEDHDLAMRYAHAAAARSDWAQAATRWQAVVRQFPSLAAGHLNAGRVLRRQLGKPDAAEAVLAPAVARFASHADLWAEFAAVARDRRDQPAAIARYQTMRERFPGRLDAYRWLADLLREAGRFDEAEATLAAALERFPDDEGALIDRAWLAHARRDWDEAVQRWAAVRRVNPDNRTSYWAAGTTLLHALARHDEADALLGEAVARFPEDAEIAIGHARAAQRRGDRDAADRRLAAAEQRLPGTSTMAELLRRVRASLAEPADAPPPPVLGPAPADGREAALAQAAAAEQRQDWPAALCCWRQVQSGFPDDPRGPLRLARLLRDRLSHAAEAERMLADAQTRFPDDVDIALDFASAAAARKAQGVAIERYTAVTERFPAAFPAWRSLSTLLREAKRLDEAERVASVARWRFPTAVHFLLELAWVAHHRGDWPEAERRWARVLEMQPDLGYAARMHAWILLHPLGRYDEADAILSQMAAARPDALDLGLEYMQVAEKRGDLPEALRRLQALAQRFPGNPAVREAESRIAHRHELDSLAMDDAAGSGPAAPAIVTAPDNAPGSALAAERSLALQFEGLGAGCEFGLAQRRLGAEPLGLLRWALIGPDALITALNNRFDGVGELENIEISINPSSKEYIMHEKKIQMQMHTFKFDDSGNVDDFRRAMARRLTVLRRKLLEDLEQAQKIFVYRSLDETAPDFSLALRDALARYGRNTLLLISLAAGDRRPGSAAWAAPGLIRGYIDRFAPPVGADPAQATRQTWLPLLQAAHALWREGAAR